MKNIRILLFGTWCENIGNAFVIKGAETCIRKACPEAEVCEVSLYPDRVAEQLALGWIADSQGQRLGELNKVLERMMIKKLEKENAEKIRANFINISELVDMDLAVLPGVIFHEGVLRRYEKTLTRLAERKIPTIFLGAGALDYREETRERTIRYFQKLGLRPEAIFTRDPYAYQYYSSLSEMSFDGIDTAFFINDWYQPPKSNQDFIVLAFDKIPEPTIETSKKVIRVHHYPMVSPFDGPIKKAWEFIRKEKYAQEQNFFFSDCIKDYLFLYANANETHTDRVHACLPALVYGNLARLYVETPRIRIFERMIEGNLNKQLVSLNRKRLQREKKDMIKELKKVIDGLV